MTRVVFILLAVLVGACTRPGPDPAAGAREHAAAEAARARDDAAWLYATATTLQLNPTTDPATRANPYPCARAVLAAQRAQTPLPPCYYLPVGGRP